MIKVVRRKIIKINESLCTGCGDCIISCAEGAIKLIDGKARIISDNLCDGVGACIGTCPVGAWILKNGRPRILTQDWPRLIWDNQGQ